jgi:hypothetical protein
MQANRWIRLVLNNFLRNNGYAEADVYMWLGKEHRRVLCAGS